jgi:23S rRNA (uracil1939-C5)-methyltransferase
MYRNNFIFTFSTFNNKSEVGIYKKKRSRELIPCEYIEIANPKSISIVRNFLDWLISKKLDIIYNFDTDDGYLHDISIRNNTNDEFMIELYLRNNPNVNDFINELTQFDFRRYGIKCMYVQVYDKHHDFRSTFKKIFGSDNLDYNFGDKVISIYPGAFFQTNNEILFDMYSYIIKSINHDCNIFFDLYCGVGVMSILVNEKYDKCFGIEINKNSIDMAKLNAEKNKISNCEFICSPVEDIVSDLIGNINEKVNIFINPPRSGLRKNVIEALNKVKKYVNSIIYLSCSEKTLTRDLMLLNYSYEKLKKFNMFLNTGHIEILTILK